VHPYQMFRAASAPSSVASLIVRGKLQSRRDRARRQNPQPSTLRPNRCCFSSPREHDIAQRKLVIFPLPLDDDRTFFDLFHGRLEPDFDMGAGCNSMTGEQPRPYPTFPPSLSVGSMMTTGVIPFSSKNNAVSRPTSPAPIRAVAPFVRVTFPESTSMAVHTWGLSAPG